MIKIKRIVFPLIHLIFFTMLLMAAGQDQNGKLYPVRQHGKWGFINREGKIVITPRFDHAIQFYKGIAAAVFNRKVGFIDRTGKFLIKPRFERTGYSGFGDEGLAMISIGGKFGYIDTKGQVVIRHIYSLTRGWSEGLNPVVSSGEKWSFIKRDERLIPKEADILWLLTSELTGWRASIRASPDQSSYKTRASHSGPTNCWSDAHSITRP